MSTKHSTRVNALGPFNIFPGQLVHLFLFTQLLHASTATKTSPHFPSFARRKQIYFESCHMLCRLQSVWASKTEPFLTFNSRLRLRWKSSNLQFYKSKVKIFSSHSTPDFWAAAMPARTACSAPAKVTAELGAIAMTSYFRHLM